MAYQPTDWGKGNTSLQYEPLMQGETIIDKPLSLLGHALQSFQYDDADAVTTPAVRRAANGQIEQYTRTIRGKKRRGVSFTMFFGDVLWTPALNFARQSSQEKVKFYTRRVCPEDPQLEHAYIYDNCVMSEPTRAQDAVTIADEQMADFQADVTAEKEILLPSVGLFLLTTAADPLYAIGIMTEDCISNQRTATPFPNVIACGGDGTADLLVVKSNDRWANVDTVATPAPTGSVGQDLYTNGDIILVGFSDDHDVSVAATGGTIISGDGGDNWVIDTNITVPVHGVGRFAGLYIAVGGTGAGAAMFWVSEDGVTWTASTSVALPAAAALTAMAVDEDAGKMYTCGEAGTLLRGSFSAGSVLLTAVTLPGSPATLNRVWVMGKDHIAVGGASGYYAESIDGGATWTQPTTPGSGAIAGIAGNDNRSFIGKGLKISQRSVLTDFDYEAMTLEDGASSTGDIMDIQSPPGSNDYAFAVTDDGEILQVKSFLPNA